MKQNYFFHHKHKRCVTVKVKLGFKLLWYVRMKVLATDFNPDLLILRMPPLLWVTSHFAPMSTRPPDQLAPGGASDCRTFRTIDVSYHGFFVPSLDFSYRSYHGLFVPSLDVSYHRRNFTYFHCLAVLEQNFSRHTVIAWLRVMVLR